MATVFISYHRQSEAIARTLAEDIQALGHRVWFDQELTGGQAWWDKILATVRECDLFVFVLEPEALNSTACNREYNYAAELRKSILPVLVSDGVATNLLPPALSEIQFVDYRKQDRNAGLRLARSLSTIPPAEPLPDPLPPPPEVPISYLGSLTAKVETTSTLTYDEQSALVFDLKRGLRDSGTNADSRTLLAKLRKRRDLYATIAEEIDELLGAGRNVSSVTAGNDLRTVETKPEPPPRQSEEPVKEPVLSEKQEPAVRSSEVNIENESTIKGRLKASAILASVAAAVGLLCANIETGVPINYAIFNPSEFNLFGHVFGGAVAGLISGNHRVGRMAAMIATLVPILVAITYGRAKGTPFIILLLPSAAAVLGIYLRLRGRRP